MDRFALAYNPNREKADEYIVHLLDPVLIIKVSNRTADYDNAFSFINRSGKTNYFFFSLHYPKIMDEPEKQRIMNRAWQWYKSYLDRKSNSTTDEQAKEN